MDEGLRFAQLRAEINAAGLNSRPTRRLLLELAVHVVLLLAGVALCFYSERLLGDVAGLVLSTFGAVGVGSNSHTSSHNATSRHGSINRLLTYLGFTFLLGLSTTYWSRKHLEIHHQFPNVYRVDGDVDFAPWLALTQDEVASARPWLRRYYRHQLVALPLLVAMIVFHMQVSGFVCLGAKLCGPDRNLRKHGPDLLALAAHYVFWWWLPAFIMPAGEVVLVYFMRCVLLSCAMFAVLAPAHFPRQAIIFPAADARPSRAFAQIATAVDFQLGRVGSWFCSGLNYQIEHHLFPAISPMHYPALSRLVRRFCQDMNYPYHLLPWSKGLLATIEAIRHPRAIW